MKKTVFITALALALLSLAGCVNNRPIKVSGVTPEPTQVVIVFTPVPEETETAAPETPAPSEAPEETVDEMGNIISGSDHYIRYLYFKNLVLYEEDEDTYLDGTVENTYVKAITCAVDIVFRDENGREIARARLQTRDGNYLLVLQPGQTTVLARILSDMSLTDLPFTLEFDKETAIRPVKPDDGSETD